MNYDYIIVGGGISGIAIAEMLSRKQNVSVLLLEKESQLASKTTGGFHEWLHTGALYTLLPSLKTLSYSLGGVDDILLFYNEFQKNNLSASEKFIEFRETCKATWFNDERIIFKYRNRSSNVIWKTMVNRSQRLITHIKSIDTLRRRAGSENFSSFKYYDLSLTGSKKRFLEYPSSDFTINSRVLIKDLVAAFVARGGAISTDDEVLRLKKSGSLNVIEAKKGSYTAKKVFLCCEEHISRFVPAKITKHFAPMFVGELNYDPEPFVELDYYPKNCINLLPKGKGIVLCGGISCKSESEALDYLEYLKTEHKKRTPELKIKGNYMGFKNEITAKGQDRGYIYNILDHTEQVSSVILGKFSLFASMAVEIYRREFRENPRCDIPDFDCVSIEQLVGSTNWLKIVKSNPGDVNGND